MHKLGVAFILLVLAACGDDDAGGPRDASLAPDAGDAGRDAQLEHDAGRDAESDAAACEQETFALLDWPATRVPLDVLCGERCSTLEQRNAELDCAPVDDAGIEGFETDDDAGIFSGLFEWWTRSTGCGSVQIATIHPSWPRIYNYDAQTGELIGAAQLDDVGQPLDDWPCVDAAYIAGEVRARCDGEVLEVCRRRP